MAKPTKKQQRHALKKQKVRAEKRRALRISSAQQADSSPYDTAPLLPATPLNDEAALRASIQKFAFRRANAPDMERALALYFGNDFVHTRTLTADEPEIAAFQEWYFFDFVPERGTRLIEQFAEEVGPTLPPAQQAMLHSWIETNRLRLFEVQEVTPGVGEVVKDLLSGEVIHGSDISMSRNARRWQIVLARILRTGERWSFTGAGWMFTPEDKHRLVRFITDRWRHYQAGHPEATFDDFYRAHSLDLLKFGQQVQADALHPLYRSAEGHELVRAGATYRVLDYRQVIERLDQAEEFVFAGPSEDVTRRRSLQLAAARAFAGARNIRRANGTPETSDAHRMVGGAGKSFIPESGRSQRGATNASTRLPQPRTPRPRAAVAGSLVEWPDRSQAGHVCCV